ncbi:MAG: DnaJ domain-containing protein [Candidatus Poribacteria bacterium]|nr:DnaJ domain-containing protein [Candidatus Poribacteria bacterium]
MAEIDYYRILEISPDASIESIKKAYRKLAIRYHPDKNQNDPAAHDRFHRISEAYSVLSDPQQRAAYDRKQGSRPRKSPLPHRAPLKRKSPRGSPFFFRPKPKLVKNEDAQTKNRRRISLPKIGSFLGGIFGKPVPVWSKSPRPIRGDDLYQELELVLHEVAEGCRKVIDIQCEEKCTRCGGTGVQRQTRIHQCSRCGGAGLIESQHGNFIVKQRCPHCAGKGNAVNRQCLSCQGTGRTERVRQIVVTLDAGIKAGTRLKVPQKGSPGLNGGPNGDLYITIKLKPHPAFVRKDDDLYCEVEINFVQAILGTTIKVPTLDGQVELTVPPGVQPDQLLRIRGKGLPRSNGKGVGDVYVRLKVALPTEVTRRERELLQRFYLDRE